MSDIKKIVKIRRGSKANLKPIPEDMKGETLKASEMYKSESKLGERPEMFDVLDKKHEKAEKEMNLRRSIELLKMKNKIKNKY
jgi:hypothetical protein